MGHTTRARLEDTAVVLVHQEAQSKIAWSKAVKVNKSFFTNLKLFLLKRCRLEHYLRSQ
jgi:hypothetical protein